MCFVCVFAQDAKDDPNIAAMKEKKAAEKAAKQEEKAAKKSVRLPFPFGFSRSSPPYLAVDNVSKTHPCVLLEQPDVVEPVLRSLC